MTEEKSNIFSRGANFFSEVREELTKVTWPSRDELYGATIVIITVIALLCLALGIFDSLVYKILSGLLIPGN